MALAIPLRQNQIEAAGRLHARLTQWQMSDRVLERVRQTFPDFDTESTLLKIVTLNGLYGTNVLALIRVAGHVAHVMAEADINAAGLEIVERMAAFPADSQKGPRRLTSFASKFAHFFIDSNRFPICDSYAAAMVSHHLKGTRGTKVHTKSYLAYVKDFHALREGAGLACSTRELDHYLWLAGVYRDFRRGNKKINVDVRQLIENPGKSAPDLRALLP